FQYYGVDGGIAALNFSAATTLLTIDARTVPTSGPSSSGGLTSQIQQGPAGSEDGFGTFNFTLNNHDSYADALLSLKFTVTGNWGGSGPAAILTPNVPNGNEVATHGAVSTFGIYDTSVGPLATGYASTGTSTTTPEPASILLVGSGVLGL